MEQGKELQERHYEAMRAIGSGADVYAYGTAVDLREVSRIKPGYIVIGKATKAPEDGATRQPYFGAMLTEEGQAALQARAVADFQMGKMA